MHRHKPALAALLEGVRQHPGYPELLEAVEAPRLPRFRISQSADPNKTFAVWAYQSGRRDQHELWLALLTGKTYFEGDTID
jgi:hypothetical protein